MSIVSLILAFHFAGYGWVKVFSCFLQNLLMDGVINAFGVIYLEVTESFGASASQAAWILSIQICTHGLVGRLYYTQSV